MRSGMKKNTKLHWNSTKLMIISWKLTNPHLMKLEETIASKWWIPLETAGLDNTKTFIKMCLANRRSKKKSRNKSRRSN